MYIVVLTLVVWKFLDTLISLVGERLVPYLGFFSYADTMAIYGMPDFIRKLTNFDGIMYVRIATNGYSLTEQAYFPLYPLLIRFVNLLIQNPILSGLLISLSASILGIFILQKYLPHVTNARNVKWVIFALLCYPTSYYFGVMYTEGLFFFLLVSTLLSIVTGRKTLATLLGFFLALTRVQGIFILIPIILMMIAAMRQKRSWYSIAAIATGPILGLTTYMGYLWKTLGDPLYFIHAQEAFGAHRSSHLIFLPQVIYRYFKIFLTADLNFQYYVAILEFVFFAFAFILLIYDLYLICKRNKLNYDRLGLNLFSFANILVPSMTGTLTAMPRYTLMSLSVFLVVAELKSRSLKYVILSFFVILHIILFALFIQGYYVT